MKIPITAFLFLLSALTPSVSAQSIQSVIVGNQGNFSDANGSVTIYEPDSKNLTPDAVPGLGTLVQSVAINHESGFIMSNTSDRVDIFDLNTNARTGQLLGIGSPRYMQAVSDDKAYISNLWGNTVSILDLNTSTIMGSISTGTNPETIAVRDDVAFVANMGFGFDSTLTMIDISSDQPLGTLNTHCDGPRFVYTDMEDDLWSVCTGKTVYNSDFTQIIEQTNAEVVVFSGTDNTELTRFHLDGQLGDGAFGHEVYFDSFSNTLSVLIGKTIHVFDTASNLEEGSLTLDGTDTVGAIAFDGHAKRWYVARIPGFTVEGYVTILDEAGAEIDRFSTGVAPAFIAFWRNETVLASEPAPDLPNQLILGQNYPNPFNPSTEIPFTLQKSSYVRLTIFDLTGKEIAVLANGFYGAGSYQIPWRATGVPGGVYLYRLESNAAVTSRFLTLVK